jgi:hypothetical protein
MALTLQTTTGFLDLFADEGISVDFNLADLRDPAAIFSPISKSFSVPATDINNQFFKHYYDVSVSGGFDPYAKQDVTLFSDDLIMISGYLQLLDVSLENTVAKQYQVLVAGETARFARNVGEKELTELALDSYQHLFNYENIVDSWQGDLFDGDIVYAPVDTRVFASDTIFGPENPFTPLRESDFYPTIKASIVFEQILTEAGYNIEAGVGIFNDSFFTDLMLLGYSKESLVPLEDMFNSKLAQVVTSAGINLPELTATIPDVIPLDTEIYDNGSNFDPAAFAYDVPVIGQYKFNVQGNISAGAGDYRYQVSMYLGAMQVQVKDFVTANQFSVDFVHQFNNLTTSNRVTFRIGGVDSSGDLDASCKMTVIDVPDAVSGFDITPSMFLPKMKQKDYVAGIAKMFNLVFVPTRHTPDMISIYSYDEWIGLGVVRNWQEVVDVSQPITIKPTTELQGKTIKMLMANGNAIIDNAYVSAFGIPHGSVEVDDTKNQFAEGEITIETPFAATITNRVTSNTTFDVIQMFDLEGKPVNSPPRLLYFNGLNGTTDYYIFRAADGTFQVQNEYPIFSVTTAGVFTATYGIPQVEGAVPPKNNLLTDYYATYLLELYASDAVMLEVGIVLEPAQLFLLDLNDQVYYDGEYWRINKIKGYDLDKMTARVELFRASFANSALCPSTVSALNNDGSVTFSGPVTQGCCEFYGYRFTDNKCYWRTSKFVKSKSAGLVGLEKSAIANVSTTTSRPTTTQYWFTATSTEEEELGTFACKPVHNYATPLFAMAEGEQQIVRITFTCTSFSFQNDYTIIRTAGGDIVQSIFPVSGDRYEVQIVRPDTFASYLQLTHNSGPQVSETWSVYVERQQVL